MPSVRDSATKVQRRLWRWFPICGLEESVARLLMCRSWETLVASHFMLV